MIETSVSFDLINAFPVPLLDSRDHRYTEITQLAGRLAAPSSRFSDWAEAVGVECGALEPDEKQDLTWRLDAAVAHAYGLTEDDVRVIFETFHIGWNSAPRLAAVLDHYRDLA